jgi:hypothetical protein
VKNHNHRGAVAVLLLGCLVATGCSQSPEATRATASTPSAVPTRVAEAELSSGTTSLPALARTASALVLARAGASTASENAVDPAIITTTQEFSVVSPIWGNLSLDESFKVKFTGGLVTAGEGAPYVLELEGQPQFESGQEYVLALLGPSEDGTYMILGGPQGRFRAVGGMLHAEAAASKTDPVIQALKGQGVTTALTQLAKLRR